MDTILINRQPSKRQPSPQFRRGQLMLFG